MTLSATDRTRHRRMRENGRTSLESLFEVLRAGFVCHLGVVVDGAPMVVPTVYGFDTSRLYFHGSVASRSLTVGSEAAEPEGDLLGDGTSGGGTPGDGTPGGGTPGGGTPGPETGAPEPEPESGMPEVCVTITHVDGLVLARSVFEHGVNYRSAMIYGRPSQLTGDDKLEGLRILTEHAAPGQWDYARRPSRRELAATTLLALSLTEASVKIASGPPDDGTSPDAELGLWAGVLPLSMVASPLVPDPALPPGIPVPPHLARLKH